MLLISREPSWSLFPNSGIFSKSILTLTKKSIFFSFLVFRIFRYRRIKKDTLHLYFYFNIPHSSRDIPSLRRLINPFGEAGPGKDWYTRMTRWSTSRSLIAESKESKFILSVILLVGYEINFCFKAYLTYLWHWQRLLLSIHWQRRYQEDHRGNS